MSHQFLAKIHDHLSRQIEATLRERALAQDMEDRDRALFLKGRADEMLSVRSFLSRHFDLATQKYY